MTKKKEFPEVIPLKSRYSDVMNRLRRVEGSYYKLETSEQTVRTGYDYDYTEITMIDPVGGPMLGVGDKLEGFTINSIHHSKRYGGFLIELI